jgi:putative aminopeptidase FrvX
LDKTELLFKELTEAIGVPGFEDEVADIMAAHLKGVATIGYDGLGSLVAEQKGKSATPKIMVAGHMDEVGFMVKSITKDGYIKFLPLGGWWGHVVLAQRVIVRTAKGDVVGVTGSKAPHVLKQEERTKVVELRDMYIDVGATDKFDIKKKLGVRLGDPIIDVLQKVGKNHPNTVYGVGTVQEEVGLRGARTSANMIDPDVGFAVDVCIAMDTPGMDGTDEKLGSGAGILVFDGSVIPNRKLRDLVIRVAERNKIPFFLTALERGGTDSGIIHLNRKGVPCLTFGVPARYIHGHVGIIHRKDYDSVVKLITAVVKELDAKTVKSLTRG